MSSETSIIGGSSDSDENALTVVPCGAPSAYVVTTETAAATLPMAVRNDVCKRSDAMPTVIRSPFPG